MPANDGFHGCGGREWEICELTSGLLIVDIKHEIKLVNLVFAGSKPACGVDFRCAMFSLRVDIAVYRTYSVKSRRCWEGNEGVCDWIAVFGCVTTHCCGLCINRLIDKSFRIFQKSFTKFWCQIESKMTKSWPLARQVLNVNLHSCSEALAFQHSMSDIISERSSVLPLFSPNLPNKNFPFKPQQNNKQNEAFTPPKILNHRFLSLFHLQCIYYFVIIVLC